MSGIFGTILNNKGKNAQMLTYYALYAIQHRGEYGCGLASCYNGHIDYKKGYGLVTSVIDEYALKLLRGDMTLGFVSDSQKEIPRLELDPKIVGFNDGILGINFDGFLLNYDELKKKVDESGFDYENNSHTEVVANLICLNYKGDILEAIRETLRELKGSYAMLVMTDTRMIAVRDRYGVKALTMGKTDEAVMFSSETCAFDAIGADFVREVEPGEMIIVQNGKIQSEQIFKTVCKKSCIFEVIYTSRPDSIVNGLSVYKMRLDSGKMLALKTDSSQADLVIAAPDSGTVAAIGYAEGSKKPYGMGIVKNRYIGRTFIEMGSTKRVNKVKIKLNALREVIDGKNVLLVDDSIVRGTTMLRTVKMLKDAGAKTVHVRVASPMVFYNCEIGVNQSVKGKMLAHDHNLEQIREIIGADSLAYIDFEDLLKAYGNPENYCTGCINNKYPMEMGENNGN